MKIYVSLQTKEYKLPEKSIKSSNIYFIFNIVCETVFIVVKNSFRKY